MIKIKRLLKKLKNNTDIDQLERDQQREDLIDKLNYIKVKIYLSFLSLSMKQF